MQLHHSAGGCRGAGDLQACRSAKLRLPEVQVALWALTPCAWLVLQVLKGCKKLNLSVHSVGRIPGGYVTNHIYTWVDPQGRSVSPPTGLPHHQNSSLRRDSEKRSHLQLLQEGDEKKVSKGGSDTALGVLSHAGPSPVWFCIALAWLCFSILDFSLGCSFPPAVLWDGMGWLCSSLTQGEAGLEGRNWPVWSDREGPARSSHHTRRGFEAFTNRRLFGWTLRG